MDLAAGGAGEGRRHVVVFSAFKAQHDRIVRQVRLKKTRTDLRSLAHHAARQKLKRAEVIAAASRIFAEHETGKYFGYLALEGGSASGWSGRLTAGSAGWTASSSSRPTSSPSC